MTTWRPYLTVDESYMRRRRWYGWQYRKMTVEERGDYFKQRTAGEISISFSDAGHLLLPERMQSS